MSRARSAALICAALAGPAGHARAQEAAPAAPPSDQVISDPELPSVPAQAPEPAQSGEQVFSDPELEGTSAPATSPTTSDQPIPSAGDSDARLRAVIHARFARDLTRDDAREEVWESTTLATLDATVRRSSTLRFALGARARYQFAALEHDVSDAESQRYELDFIPTAGYADISPASGVHVQIGYQGVHLGRFDIFSASNVLAVSDLRDGPATMPEAASEVGQIAALVDYDVTSWLSVRAVYVPFFTPHLVSFTESDYALFPAAQEDTEMALAAAAGVDANPDILNQRVHDYLSRGDRAAVAATGFSALAPEPSFTQPQAALRITAHGTAGELALTAATALEHLPSIQLSHSLVDYLYEMQTEGEVSALTETALAGNPKPLSVEYDRFAVFSADGAADVGPFSIGAEAAFMKGRSLYATREAGMSEGYPGAGKVDLVQLGLRGEFIRGTEWLVALETFVAYALETPSDAVCKEPESVNATSKCTWMFLEDGRYVRGAATLISFAPAELGLHLELSAGVLSGPSFLFAPRIGYAIIDELEVEIGALVVEGKAPSSFGGPQFSLGGRYDTVDHAFIGLRYLP